MVERRKNISMGEILKRFQKEDSLTVKLFNFTNMQTNGRRT